MEEMSHVKVHLLLLDIVVDLNSCLINQIIVEWLTSRLIRWVMTSSRPPFLTIKI